MCSLDSTLTKRKFPVADREMHIRYIYRYYKAHTYIYIYIYIYI